MRDGHDYMIGHVWASARGLERRKKKNPKKKSYREQKAKWLKKSRREEQKKILAHKLNKLEQ